MKELLIVQVQIKAWGNSQGICSPKELLREAGFGTDEILHAEAHDGRIVLTRSFQRRSLQERAALHHGQLNLSAEMPREEPVGSEVW